MKTHTYQNSNPSGFDANCLTCGGKLRDSQHGATDELRAASILAPELPAYRIFRNDGGNYVTSMAKGISLIEARAYFLGQSFTDTDEKKWTCVDVKPA